MPPKGADEVSRIPKPVPLVRQAQAQKWSRARSNFPQTQGPVARREFGHSLRFCAPEIFCLVQGVTPVIGDRGPTPPVRGRCREATEGGRVGEYGHEVSILSRPPAILKVKCPEGVRAGGLGHWVLSHRWERNSPHRAKSCETAAESSRPTKRRKQHSPPALRPQARQGELVRRTKRRPPGGFGAQPPQSSGS